MTSLRALLVLLCLTSCDDVLKPPAGDYELVEIIGGSLYVSRGNCDEQVDIALLRERANKSVVAMKAAWGMTESVSNMPVVMAIAPVAQGALADGIYYADEVWIELRCRREVAIEWELYHAIAHRFGVWCWQTIGHEHDLNCESKNDG